MGQVNREEGMNKALEGFYHYIGYQHVSQTAQSMGDLHRQALEVEYPRDLHDWFNQYTRKMKNKERNRKRKTKFILIAQRAAVIGFILIASVSITTFSVDAYRVKVMNLIEEVHDTFTSFTFEEKQAGDTDAKLLEGLSNYYYPTTMPQKYKLSKVDAYGDMKILRFVSKNGEPLEIYQSSHDVNMQVDTEEATVKEVSFAGLTGKFIVKSERNTLIWFTDERMLYIVGQESEQEMVGIAESMKWRE